MVAVLLSTEDKTVETGFVITSETPPVSPIKKQKPFCVHCKKNKAQRSRQLCVKCYDNLEIRNSTPPVTLCGYRGLSYLRSPKLATLPTSALPGSIEKIRVMQERLSRGEAVFHPDDLTVEQHNEHL